MRDIPYREHKPKQKIESDAQARSGIAAGFIIPDGGKEFKDGYRECVDMFALHSPNRRGVAKILDDHCISLEEACLRSSMARDDVARYEGYRQAMKDLKRTKKMR